VQVGELAQKVEVQFEIHVGETNYGPGRLITALGLPAAVRVEGVVNWEVQMTTTQLPDGKLQIITAFRTGTPLVDLPSKHTQITIDGEPFGMTVGDAGTSAALKLQRVVRLISAAEVPQK
jgi:hypothetical protein